MRYDFASSGRLDWRQDSPVNAKGIRRNHHHLPTSTRPIRPMRQNRVRVTASRGRSCPVLALEFPGVDSFLDLLCVGHLLRRVTDKQRNSDDKYAEPR